MASNEKLSTLDLIVGAVGVSPIPVVGEICSTIFFIKILKNIPFGDHAFTRLGIAAATTGLMRMQLYTSLYTPLYQKATEYLR